jgi:hypothetical protein
VQIVARTVYGAFGGLALVLSVLALFNPSLALPSEAYSALSAHLVREQAAGGLFIGLMFLWCLRHFDRRRPVHFALILFTAVFAGIHWNDYFHASRHLLSPLLNSVPFLSLVAITPVSFMTGGSSGTGGSVNP